MNQSGSSSRGPGADGGTDRPGDRRYHRRGVCRSDARSRHRRRARHLRDHGRPAESARRRRRRRLGAGADGCAGARASARRRRSPLRHRGRRVQGRLRRRFRFGARHEFPAPLRRADVHLVHEESARRPQTGWTRRRARIRAESRSCDAADGGGVQSDNARGNAERRRVHVPELRDCLKSAGFKEVTAYQLPSRRRRSSSRRLERFVPIHVDRSRSRLAPLLQRSN